jgi:hypothetical protein
MEASHAIQMPIEGSVEDGCREEHMIQQTAMTIEQADPERSREEVTVTPKRLKTTEVTLH